MQPPPPSDQSEDASKQLLKDIAFLCQEARAEQAARAKGAPLPVTQDQIAQLVKLAERDRPVVVRMKAETVAGLLGERLAELNGEYLTKSEQLIKQVDERTNYLAKELKAGVAAVQAATAGLAASARLIPSAVAVKGDFHGFTSWKAGAVVGGVPVLIVLLMLWVTGMFSRVPAADFKQLQAKNAALQAQLAALQVFSDKGTKEGVYYLNQIRVFKLKHQVKKDDFPSYDTRQKSGK